MGRTLLDTIDETLCSSGQKKTPDNIAAQQIEWMASI